VGTKQREIGEASRDGIGHEVWGGEREREGGDSVPFLFQAPEISFGNVPVIAVSFDESPATEEGCHDGGRHGRSGGQQQKLMGMREAWRRELESKRREGTTAWLNVGRDEKGPEEKGKWKEKRIGEEAKP